MIELDRFYSVLAQEEARGYDLNDEQKQAVEHQSGPLWLIAGPGSGKSEVLITRALKLMCVDGVTPRSIMMTTFTKKAARNLEDRLASYMAVLQSTEADLKDIDLADVRTGTIHSLCDDILHEYRYPLYQNVRLLDDVDQNLFTYRHAEIADYQNLAFWAAFEHCVPMWRANSGYLPNKWARVKAAVVLFNHIVEDMIDVNKMRATGEHWATLADFYAQYAQALIDHYRCDFAHVQARFYEFITATAGARLLEGDGEERPALEYVLVDEYQDTNPIQERIYLALTARAPHNLTVVGDDDQALYRFRGGTVAGMVNFDKACHHVFEVAPHQIQLDKNYRSHEQVVEFINAYITSFPEMNTPGVRAPNKKPITAESEISKTSLPYYAVAWINRTKAAALPDALVGFIKDHLLKDGVISDLSQCVLLMRSTRDSPRNAGPFLEAFERHEIPVYNPRSKSFMESEEVQCLLAALIHVIDLDFAWGDNTLRDFTEVVQGWVETLIRIHDDPTVETQSLYDYIIKSNEELPKLCAKERGSFLNLSLLEIIYRIISREPFVTWRQDPVRNLRLSKVTRLFESYHSLNLDGLRANDEGTALAPGFLNRFYYMFVSYLINTGIDDDEDEEVIVPQGLLPLMTVHQAKGLEFPFVFVDQLGAKGQVSATQILEHELAPFRQNLYPREIRSAELLALEDDIRLLYVAYSRAQYGLILVATQNQLKNHVAMPGRDFTEFRRNTLVVD